jgi:hypothetical protein
MWIRSLVVASLVALLVSGVASAEDKRLLWGDTHLHSRNSFDAYLNRNMTADPATAYRFAMGLPVVHPFHRARVQIETPLDFLVVADHAENLGVMGYVVDRGIPRDGMGLLDRIRAWIAEYMLGSVVKGDGGLEAFVKYLPVDGPVREAAEEQRTPNIPRTAEMERTVWLEAIETADRYNAPGSFTTLIGWEWSAIPAGANLHRVVFTNADASVARLFRPWSSIDSQFPEDLWAWLDETAKNLRADFIAIPHNSNISRGYMFTESTLRGEPLTAEKARTRLRWEPVVEVTQIKGDSETHPVVSPDDPFADFETYPHYIMQDAPEYDPQPGDYVRSALRLGLALERKLGVNPYRFGMIGSTDSHTGVASAEEPNFWGKLARDSIPENKGPMGGRPGGTSGWAMSASGLAAVWAEENSRDSIMRAFERREVYATTGPRIGVRVFGGWDFQQADASSGAIGEIGYARGVPMGGVLTASPAGGTPRFLIHASMDPKSARLDRVQVVKGWIDASGVTHERVFDARWSGMRIQDEHGHVAPVRNTVDPDTGTYRNEYGNATFALVWRDPDFDATQSAFYYVRVLEVPTPRHSVFDALALDEDPRKIGFPWWIQERAYTSPIWYSPEGG